MARSKPAPALSTDDPPPRHAMRAEWVDPSDIKPNASRVPRKIRGWRTYCPLRRMSGHPASGITDRHIMAADRLREAVDLATLGYSSERPLIHVAQYPLPRWGMSRSAVEQMRAVRDIARVGWIFGPAALALIDAVLLRNMSLREWTQRFDPPLHPAGEKRKLLAVLDRLVEHYDTEIKDDMAHDRRLAP
jgi:hypothetical protein